MSQPIALVTGASRGIGAATAVLLARAGYRTVLNYHTCLLYTSYLWEMQMLPLRRWRLLGSQSDSMHDV